MKVLGSLLAASASAQFSDYDFDNSGRFGSLTIISGVNPNSSASVGPANASPSDAYTDVSPHVGGHAGNKRFCHGTDPSSPVFNWTSSSRGGYFAYGLRRVECIGEELYCYIEERAQFGQIIGITAGCEQMMNHPAVNIVDQQKLISATFTQINAIKNNYNQEAARGGMTPLGLYTYYGIGGCLAMPAQNGHQTVNQVTTKLQRYHAARGTIHADEQADADTDVFVERTADSRSPYQLTGVDHFLWTRAKYRNYYRHFHGGFGQNQCLRFPRFQGDATGNEHINQNTGDRWSAFIGGNTGQTHNFDGAPGKLLPFGVSVCRACCVAEMASAIWAAESFHTTNEICNYPPDTQENIEQATGGDGGADTLHAELVPRFDGKNLFEDNGLQEYTYMAQGETGGFNPYNNLFVHIRCDTPGPARGCSCVDWAASEADCDRTSTSYTCNGGTLTNQAPCSCSQDTTDYPFVPATTYPLLCPSGPRYN